MGEKKTENTRCLVQDGNIFLGLTSLSLGEDRKIISAIDSLFQNVKRKLNERFEKFLTKELSSHSSGREKKMQGHSDLNEFFYNYKVFYLFGKFDLGIISFTDGFDFPAREFSLKGFHKNGHASEALEISRHNIIGPTPKFANDDITSLHARLFAKSNRFPLVSISRLKINDLFLFEDGTSFIRGVIKLLNLELKNKRNGDFDFLILENYGWSEICVLLLVDSYCKAADLMFEIRSLKREDLNVALEQVDPILKNIISDEHKRINFEPGLNSYLFIDSHSILGFDYDLFFSENKGNFRPIDIDEIIKHQIEISAKPGSVKSVIKDLNGENVDNELSVGFNTLPGKSDIVHFISGDSIIKTRTLIDWVIDFRQRKSHSAEYINKLSTSIITRLKLELNPGHSHYLNPKEIQELIFNSDKIKKLEEQLDQLFVPHVIKDTVLDLFSIFNNNICNQLSFANFLELWPFLDYLDEIINNALITSKKSQKNDFNELLKRLDTGIHAFHYAYYNRILGNYNTGDQYDHPMFFNLGAQSLISAFDVVYKNIALVLGNRDSFVYVESDQDFTTSDFALRLNYSHLFNPELLCAVLFQEATNQCESRYCHLFPSLFIYHRKFENDQSTELIDWNLRINGVNIKKAKLYKQFINWLNPEFFEHIFSDLVGYKMFYQEHPDMYLYWSWAFFSTDSKHYFGEGESINIKEDFFMPYLLRQLIVLKCLESEKYENYQLDFDPKLSCFGPKAVESAKKFIDNYLFKGNFLIWFNDVKKFTLKLSNDVKKHNAESNGKSIMDKLITGEVINYSATSKSESIFCYTRDLLFYYLKAVMTVTEGPKEINIYDKDPIKDKIESYAELMFDPQGGTIIPNPEIRRKIFKLRSAFHMSLVDMSLKRKGELLKEILNKSSNDNVTFSTKPRNNITS